MEIASNIMLYGSEVWAETLGVKKRRHVVQCPPLAVIANTIPVDLLGAERTEIYKAKSTGQITGDFRENTITKWQRKWSNERQRRGRALSRT